MNIVVNMYNNQMLRFEQSYTLEKIKHTLKISDYYEEYVDFNQTEKACKICDQYNNNWSCPPFEDNIQDVWKKYKNIELTLLKLNYNEFITENTFSKGDMDTILNITLHNEKRKMLQELNKKIRFDEEYENAMILSTGYCNLCPECTRKDKKACRYPKNKLYSMESLGALVSKTTEEIFDTKILWLDNDKGKIPKYLTILMGLLH